MKNNTNRTSCENKKSTNGKGRKNYRKRNTRYKAENQTDGIAYPKSAEDARNDFSWYNRNPLLTRAVASVPFPYRPGMFIPWANDTGDSATVNPTDSIPGIMAIYWEPTIGQTSTATDPASIVGKEIFSKVREAFSGSIDADAPDFVIYLMSLDSIFSYIAQLKRLYRTVSVYSPNNLVTPDALIQAYFPNFSLDDIAEIKANKMQLFQVINELVGMTRKFRCPAVFDVFNRHYWMNDNVYLDAPTQLGQMYVFSQDGYYQFTLASTPQSTQAGGLTIVSPTLNSGTLVSDMFAFGRQLIDALAGSDDAYIISGYLARAFESSPKFEVSNIEIDEVLTPVFDPLVLSQISNLVTVDAVNNDVSQDPTTNALICSPTVGLGDQDIQRSVVISPILNINSENPSLEEVVEATRLHCWIDEDGKVICATELPKLIRFIFNPNVTQGYISGIMNQFTYMDTTATVGTSKFNVVNFARDVAIITKFAGSPKFYVGIKGSNGKYDAEVFGDYLNPTTLTDEMLKNLHRVCLYSEFNSFGVY